jgi:ABC-2 type transport system ATP-binding protein
MIRLEHLAKKFGGRPALHDLSLEIPAGEIFGLLGHNGAGKSTTFGILLGQVHPGGGEAFIRGISVQRDRLHALDRVGAIFETPAFYDYLSGWRNLRILTAYSARLGDAEISETVRFVGLSERIHDPVRMYSHGMRQRLALAQALLPRPELLLLDEPAEGLDPEGIREMRELILQLNREHGMTVVLSSHILSEVEQLCDRIAILNQGKLIYEGRWNELRGQQSAWRLEVDDWDKAGAVIAGAGGALAAGGVVSLQPPADISQLVAALVGDGVRVRAVVPMEQTLEQLYLERIAGQ